jgi:hypothetical protein
MKITVLITTGLRAVSLGHCIGKSSLFLHYKKPPICANLKVKGGRHLCLAQGAEIKVTVENEQLAFG